MRPRSGKTRLLIGGLSLTALCALAAAAAQNPDPARLGLLMAVAGAGGVLMLALLLADKRLLFFLLLVARATCDPLLDALRSPSDQPGMGAGAILNALMILLGALFFLHRPQRGWGVALPAWLPFLAATAVSTLLAPQWSTALRLLMVQLSYCAVFLLPFYLVRSRADAVRCLHALLCSSVAPALTGLLQLATGATAEGRVQGSFNHPNIFAFYLLLIIIVIFYLQKSQASHGADAAAGGRLVRRGAPLLWLYMGVLLLLLVCTKTRSAWAGCGFIFIIFGLVCQRRYLLYAVAAPLLLLLDPGVRDRLLDLTSNNEVSGTDGLNSYAWRVVLWQAGLAWMQMPHHLYGYGLSTFSYYSPQFFPLDATRNWESHNVYVQLFFETGAAGIAGFAYLFYRVLRALAAGVRHDRAGSTILIAMVAGYLIVCYSDNLLYYLAFNWYFWFFIGTACAALTLRTQPGATLPRHVFAPRPGQATRQGAAVAPDSR
jgi:hypothetical protein